MLLDKKELTARIKSLKAEQLSNQEIFDQLKGVHVDKDELAKFVLTTPSEEIKKRYKGYNNALIFLLLASLILKLFVVVDLLAISTSLFLSILLILVSPLLQAIILFAVARFQVSAYRPLAIMVVVLSIRSIFNFETSMDLVVNVFFVGGISGLLYYIYSQVVPVNIQQLNKDSYGDYIFPSAEAHEAAVEQDDQEKEAAQIRRFQKQLAHKTEPELIEIAKENSTHVRPAQLAAQNLLKGELL